MKDPNATAPYRTKQPPWLFPEAEYSWERVQIEDVPVMMAGAEADQTASNEIDGALENLFLDYNASM